MHELLRSNDPVLISFLTSHLSSIGIEALVLDTHASIVEGSIGAIPRRVVVLEEDAPRARRAMAALLPEWMPGDGS